MVLFPNAKINIGLHVTAKRPDGFHAIATFFYPLPLHDILEVVPAAAFSLHLYGIPVEGTTADNLCVKAYRLLQKEFELPPVAIHLYKAIPSGAGLGGGSSDATYTLLLLNRLFHLNLQESQLAHYALQLGSDCAFFVYDKPLLAEGRGELFIELPVNLKKYTIVVVKPPVFISTAEAYAGVVPRQPVQPLSVLIQQPVEEWKNTVGNDFETAVFSRYPSLAQIKEQFYNVGALYAAMSGSGSAIFGLFVDEKAAGHAMQRFSNVIFCGSLR